MWAEATPAGPDTADFHVCENGDLKWAEVGIEVSLPLSCSISLLSSSLGLYCMEAGLSMVESRL